MKRAALYLRSSKDRSDVSIDAQRRELAELATARGFVIVEEFTDVVISGKDEHRAGFQAMLRGLHRRRWSAILMLDTSRLARSQYVAHMFRHECRKRGVEVVFAKTPEVDGVAGIILPAVLHAMDEVHSFMSREKGLAGMAENVRRGWRAGGRAPFGYRLERVETGAIREGEPVAKTRLVPGPDFDQVAAYLRGRVAGRGQRALIAELGLKMSGGSLVGIERNALTYAGHTVWNSKRGTKPREEWVIQRDTHPAAISESDAEALLARLGAPRRTRDRGEGYLLAGLLRAPDGRAWQGNSGFYRMGRKNISAPRLEEEVMRGVVADLLDPAFAAGLVAAAQAVDPPAAEAEHLVALDAEVRRLEKRAAVYGEILPTTTARETIVRNLEETERAIREARARAERLKATAIATQRLREVTPADVEAMLKDLAVDLPDFDRGEVKDFLAEIVERVELDAGAATCTIHYRIAASGVNLASPRGGGDNPTLRVARLVALPFRRLRAA